MYIRPMIAFVLTLMSFSLYFSSLYIIHDANSKSVGIHDVLASNFNARIPGTNVCVNYNIDIDSASQLMATSHQIECSSHANLQAIPLSDSPILIEGTYSKQIEEKSKTIASESQLDANELNPYPSITTILTKTTVKEFRFGKFYLPSTNTCARFNNRIHEKVDCEERA